MTSIRINIPKKTKLIYSYTTNENVQHLFHDWNEKIATEKKKLYSLYENFITLHCKTANKNKQKSLYIKKKTTRKMEQVPFYHSSLLDFPSYVRFCWFDLKFVGYIFIVWTDVIFCCRLLEMKWDEIYINLILFGKIEFSQCNINF